MVEETWVESKVKHGYTVLLPSYVWMIRMGRGDLAQTRQVVALWPYEDTRMQKMNNSVSHTGVSRRVLFL